MIRQNTLETRCHVDVFGSYARFSYSPNPRECTTRDATEGSPAAVEANTTGNSGGGCVTADAEVRRGALAALAVRDALPGETVD